MSKLDQLLEDAILGRVVGSMLDNRFRVVVSDQDGGGLYVYGIPDNGEKPPEDGYSFWVVLVPGNGIDMISDYSVNLQKIISPALELCKEYDDN